MEKGPRGLRRGRGARERILSASQQLFRDQGINRTGLDQLCAVAEVSKRTLYQHFAGKDELIAEYLRRFDPDILPEVFDRTDLTPRERLLATFDVRTTRPCARSSRRPSKSPTRATRHAFTPATTRRPLPRGSPIPPARPAPPTPNSSASNWRCSWTAPRPAAGSSTPTPSPPPPPSPPSSSTTPSPRQPGGVSAEVSGLLLFGWQASDSPVGPRRPGRGRPWRGHGIRPQRRGLVDVHERVAGQERGFAPAVDEPGNLRVAGRIDGCPGAANPTRAHDAHGRR